MDIIKLHSKGETNSFLRKLSKPDNSESLTYVLKVTDPFVKVGKINSKSFIEPVGGPSIVEGETLEEAGMVVKSIDYTVGYGYTITFK